MTSSLAVRLSDSKITAQNRSRKVSSCLDDIVSFLTNCSIQNMGLAYFDEFLAFAFSLYRIVQFEKESKKYALQYHQGHHEIQDSLESYLIRANGSG